MLVKSKDVVDWVGFEPTTTYVSPALVDAKGMQGRYSTGLNYQPTDLTLKNDNLSVLFLSSRGQTGHPRAR